jgi:hypothetical protein
VEDSLTGDCIVVDLPKRTEERAVKGATSTARSIAASAAKGLIRKDYLNGEAGTGGVYLSETRAAAEAWFTEDRMDKVLRRFLMLLVGVDGLELQLADQKS